METKKGLTFAVIVGFLYTALILLPANLFAQLSLGIAIGGYAAYVAIMLVAILYGRGFRKMSKQEVTLLYLFSSIPGSGLIGMFLLQAIYFRDISPLTWSFIDPFSGKPLPELIPNWYAPPPNAQSIIARNLFHPDFLVPILLLLVVWVLISLMDISLGYIMFNIFSEQENLPFPTAEISASAISTLAELPKERMRVISIAGLIGIIYSAVAYLSQSFGTPIIPIPWIDFNSVLEKFLPGASFGIATDPLSFASGWIIPFNVAVWLFIGSFLIYFVGNCLLVQKGLFTDWSPGMNVTLAYQRSVLDFWFYLALGFGVVIALAPLIFRGKTLLALVKRTGGTKLEEKTMFSIRNMVFIFIASSVVLAILVYYLTGFPVLLLFLLLVLWKFIASSVSTMMLGLSGISTDVPYVKNLAIYASGYTRVDMWFVPSFDSAISGSGPAGIAFMFRVAKLTETDFSEVIKGIVLASAVGWLIAIPFAAILWKIAPIPSTLYRAVDIYWPIGVIMSGIWITRKISISAGLPYVAGGVIVGGILVILENLVHVPFISAVGLLAGISTPIPSAFSLFVGALVGYVVGKTKLSVQWNKYKVDVAVGLILGSAIMVVLSTAALMLSRGVWVLPY
jgi:hypothetical protein